MSSEKCEKMEPILSYDKIQEENLIRYSTGFPDLDMIYGITHFPNNRYSVGLPAGKISLWAGAGGVGKTRVAVEMVLKISAVGLRVLFYQNEVSPTEFKGWVKKPVIRPENLFVGNVLSLDDQIQGIKNIHPHVVIVDSINMMEGFTSPEELRNILQTYKGVAEENKCHVIFISHLNKQGEVKGNNDVEYLVDVVCRLNHHTTPGTKQVVKGVFYLEIGKNRFGPSGGYIAFSHTDTGVEFLVSSLTKMPEVQKSVPHQAAPGVRQFCGQFKTRIINGNIIHVPIEVIAEEKAMGTYERCLEDGEWGLGNFFKKMFG